ncbi:hypothetical protein GBA52_026954 [Prunus armeniaca]|nr:hypothetical protein GBA52_026954 [Prunus armeniaca]
MWISVGEVEGGLRGCDCMLQVMGKFSRSENRPQSIVGCWGGAKRGLDSFVGKLND